MNWWRESACQRRMVRSGTSPGATRSVEDLTVRPGWCRGSTCRSSPPPRGWCTHRSPGQAPHAVAGEQPHPHVGVGGAADGGVEQALLLDGGAAHHRGGLRTNEELRSSRRSASLGSRYRSRRNVCSAPVHAVDVHDVDPEQQHALAGRCPADRVEHGRRRARQQVVVVVELHDPLAGGDLHGPVHVLDQAQRRPVPDVAVPRGPVGQDPFPPRHRWRRRRTRRTRPPRCARPRARPRGRPSSSARSSRPGRLRVGIVIDSAGGCMWFTRRPGWPGRFRPATPVGRRLFRTCRR